MQKKKKEEEIDVSLLPPWQSISVRLNYECSRENSERISDFVYNANFETKRLITRNDIISYGKEKLMYVDPNQLSDKQKKDKNFAEIPTELTPELMAKIYSAFYNEIVLNARKLKKERIDALAAGKEIPAASQKKDSKDPNKAGAKKDAKKPDIKEEEKKEEPPLDSSMKKACDFIYFLSDYPQTHQEIQELAKLNIGLDLLIRVKEKSIEKNVFEDSEVLQNEEAFNDDLKNRLSEFVDGQESKKYELMNMEKSKKAHENIEFIQKSEEILKFFKDVRKKSGKKDSIRNLVIKEITCLFDAEIDLKEIGNVIKRQIYEEICSFSLDIENFGQWIKDKKVIPLLDQKELKSDESEPALLQAVAQDVKDASKQGAKKDDPKDKKDSKVDPKLSKGAKKSPDELKKEEVIQEEIKPSVQVIKIEEPKEESLINYEKQLSAIDEENITIGALLEAVIEEISHNSLSTKESVQKNSEFDKIFDEFQQDLINDMSRIKATPLANPLPDSSIKNPYETVLDESDEISRRNLYSKFENLEDVGPKEHQILNKMLIPGIDRNLMPEKALKSIAIRKAEKSQLHPFVSFDISDFERFQILEKLEEMMRSNDRDREWNFGDRIYQERLNSLILKQRLYQNLLFEPEVLSTYDEQNDALLLSLFFKNPPGRILRKKWTCQWRVLPNLENWINFFKDNDKNLFNEFFYDIDYSFVENLHERIKFMYPNDLSIIMCSQFKVADEIFNHFRILKENILFGIRKSTYKNSDFAELWSIFENGTKLLVEIEKEGRLDHANEMANPDKSTENPKLDENDHYIDRVHKPGTTFSLTLRNGLIVKYLTNGYILQTYVKGNKQKAGKIFDEVITDNYQKEEASSVEKSRLITGKGSVIKYMKDGSIQIMFANGNFSVYKKATDTWITTNNKGLKKARRIKDGLEHELEPVPSAKKTDPETGCKILIREDKVMVIAYPDGSVYTEHKDGTNFLTSSDGNITLIEHPDFASVKIINDPIKARMQSTIGPGSSSAYQGCENIMERSYNGRVTETYIPDGSKVVGFLEKRELEGYENYETNNIHLIYQPEGSVLKVKDDGEVVIISAKDRVELNEQGEKKSEHDIDYFLQLFGIPEDRKKGVYTAELKKKNIWTKDDEGNYFSLSSTGETKGKIAVSFDLNQNNAEIERPGTPDFPEGEFIEEQNQFLPPPRTVISPKLFYIGNNNDGSEYFNENQLSHYFRIKHNNPSECTKIVEAEIPGIPNCESITYLTRYLTFQEKKKKYINVNIPKNVDIIPQTKSPKEEPIPLRFLYRNLLKFMELDETKREILQKDMEKYNIWKKNQAKETHEFGIKERNEDEKEKEYKIQQKILDSRMTDYHSENYQESYDKIIDRILPSIADGYIKAWKSKMIETDKTASIPVSRKEKFRIPKSWNDILKRLTPKKPEIFPLNIDPTQVDWKDTLFVPNYFHTYVGNQFQKTIPAKRDIKEILEDKAKLRKTRELMKLDPGLTEDEDKKLQPKSIIQIEREVSQPTKKEFNESRILSKSITPSWNMKGELDRKQKEEENIKKAEEYKGVKTIGFNVYGKKREEIPAVTTLYRPVPEKILNTKYIITESSTEPRVRISSMANRPHIYAPSIDEIRSQGTYELLKQSLDKKNNRESLLEKKDLMTTASVTDPLKRDLLIIPVNCNFGRVKKGGYYERIIRVKNEDPLPQRINIKQSKKTFITAKQIELGTLAMGMVREISVSIKVPEDDYGTFLDYFEIVSKHDIYRIPVSGEIVDANEVDIERNLTKSRAGNHLKSASRPEMSESRISDDMPVLRYERNTKLDVNINAHKTEDSYQSADIEQE